MLQTVCRAIVAGYVSRIEQSKYNQAIVNISVETYESYKDKETGQDKQITQYHNVNAYGTMAEKALREICTGSLVYIEGRIGSSKYKDKSTGEDKYRATITASDIKVLMNARADKKQEQAEFDSDIPF